MEACQHMFSADLFGWLVMLTIISLEDGTKKPIWQPGTSGKSLYIVMVGKDGNSLAQVDRGHSSLFSRYCRSYQCLTSLFFILSLISTS